MKRTFVLSCAALIGLTGSAAVAAGAQAAEKPLAPIASAVLPDAPTDAAAQQMEDASVDMLAHPEESAGSWYDGGKRQVVLGLKGKASAAFSAELATFTKSGARVQPVTRSFGDLRRIAEAVMATREIGGAKVNQAALDWQTNRVEVGIQPVTDAARQKLAALYGDAVTVEEMSPMRSEDGPDRRRDRYPYWGGSAWSTLNRTTHACSTAFPMKRPDNSKKFLVTAGHCNSPTANDAYTANTAGTTFNVQIGTAVGYANSLCPSTGSSCDIGSTKYGDISVLRVSGNAPRIYNGTDRATGSLAIVSTQTGHPAVGDSMCISGATTGTFCGYRVINNFTYVTNTEGQLRSPVVRMESVSGVCTAGGDSGGAVYRPDTGGIRASGIHSGSSRDSSGNCFTHYTSIYYAQQLFAAETVTTSNY